MPAPSECSFDAAPGPRPRSVRTSDGVVLAVPEGWDLLEPGDAGLTRKVKAAGPSWTVKEKRGRKMFSRGVWAPAQTIVGCREAVEATRSTPAYRNKLAADRQRRQRKHEEYAAEFEAEVRDFLDFHPRHVELARSVARLIARHATPVGSGTVARTERIPIEQRAEAAVIAWLRHQTTAYDRMQIKRVKGRRREVRRELAQASRRLLGHYRRDGDAPLPCPLQQAVDRESTAPGEPVESVEPVASASPSPPRPPTEAGSSSPDDRDAAQRAIQARVLARFKR